METPSSTRRVTRSQTSAAMNNNSNSNRSYINNIPVSNSDSCLSKSRPRNGKQQDRSALIDVTNDSPIVGLASGNLETPLSSIAKQRGSRMKNTPGSGEALLRGQVKTLLQKVEEEAELSKLSLESRPFIQLANSPMGLVAPTPANTPQISNLSSDEPPVTHPIIEEHLVSQLVNQIFDGKNQESPESEKSQITRSLLLDFSEKSEISDASECSSELTYEEVEGGVSGCKEKPSTEDDDASIWSIQVNASARDEDEEGIEEKDEEDYYEDIDLEEEEEDDDDDDDGGLLDELCQGLSNISVNEREGPKFAGKHTRFVYNSDDELAGEEEESFCQSGEVASPGILRLKGLPTPKGKHLRFPEEEEEGRKDEGKFAL